MVVGRVRRGVEANVANLVLTVVEPDSDQRAAFARCRERVNDLLPRLRDTAGGLRKYAGSSALAVECVPEAAAPVIAEADAAGIERLGGPRDAARAD